MQKLTRKFHPRNVAELHIQLQNRHVRYSHVLIIDSLIFQLFAVCLRKLVTHVPPIAPEANLTLSESFLEGLFNITGDGGPIFAIARVSALLGTINLLLLGIDGP